MYERFNVYRYAGGAEIKVGSVDAQSAEEAVYRLAGAPYGRTDYVAHQVDRDPIAHRVDD
jgi:hypothetical protein